MSRLTSSVTGFLSGRVRRLVLSRAAGSDGIDLTQVQRVPDKIGRAHV